MKQHLSLILLTFSFYLLPAKRDLSTQAANEAKGSQISQAENKAAPHLEEVITIPPNSDEGDHFVSANSRIVNPKVHFGDDSFVQEEVSDAASFAQKSGIEPPAEKDGIESPAEKDDIQSLVEEEAEDSEDSEAEDSEDDDIQSLVEEEAEDSEVNEAEDSEEGEAEDSEDVEAEDSEDVEAEESEAEVLSFANLTAGQKHGVAGEEVHEKLDILNSNLASGALEQDRASPGTKMKPFKVMQWNILSDGLSADGFIAPQFGKTSTTMVYRAGTEWDTIVNDENMSAIQKTHRLMAPIGDSAAEWKEVSNDGTMAQLIKDTMDFKKLVVGATGKGLKTDMKNSPDCQEKKVDYDKKFNFKSVAVCAAYWQKQISPVYKGNESYTLCNTATDCEVLGAYPTASGYEAKYSKDINGYQNAASDSVPDPQFAPFGMFEKEGSPCEKVNQKDGMLDMCGGPSLDLTVSFANKTSFEKFKTKFEKDHKALTVDIFHLLTDLMLEIAPNEIQSILPASLELTETLKINIPVKHFKSMPLIRYHLEKKLPGTKLSGVEVSGASFRYHSITSSAGSDSWHQIENETIAGIQLRKIHQKWLLKYSNALERFNRKWGLRQSIEGLDKLLQWGSTNEEEEKTGFTPKKGRGKMLVKKILDEDPDILMLEENDHYRFFQDALQNNYSSACEGDADCFPDDPRLNGKARYEYEMDFFLPKNYDGYKKTNDRDAALVSEEKYQKDFLTGTMKNFAFLPKRDSNSQKFHSRKVKKKGEFNDNDGSSVFWKKSRFKLRYIKKAVYPVRIDDFSKKLPGGKEGGVVGALLEDKEHPSRWVWALSTHVPSGDSVENEGERILMTGYVAKDIQSWVRDSVRECEEETKNVSTFRTGPLGEQVHQWKNVENLCEKVEMVVGMDGNTHPDFKLGYSNMHSTILARWQVPRVLELKPYTLNVTDKGTYPSLTQVAASVNKMRGLGSAQPWKIGAYQCNRIDYVIRSDGLDEHTKAKLPVYKVDFRNPQEPLEGCADDPQTCVDEMYNGILPNKDNPSDHLPFIVTLQYKPDAAKATRPKKRKIKKRKQRKPPTDPYPTPSPGPESS